jgi:hypothetical protein
MADKRSAPKTDAFGICPRCDTTFDPDLFDIEHCGSCHTEFSTHCCLGSVSPDTGVYVCIECAQGASHD